MNKNILTQLKASLKVNYDDVNLYFNYTLITKVLDHQMNGFNHC